MKIKKKELFEIIDSNNELIGKDDIPKNGANLETQASNTTDYNQKIGTQPYRFDYLGRMGLAGFGLFFEDKEDDSSNELLKDLSKLMHEKQFDVLKYYYKNPNKLKSDYRKQETEENNHSEECEKNDNDWAKKIIKIIKPYLEKAFKENIDEGKVAEDKVIDKKNEDELSKKGEDKEIKEKKLEKIAGLINKLEKKDIDKLINLLEMKK
jgi:hypothetical protein